MVLSERQKAEVFKQASLFLASGTFKKIGDNLIIAVSDKTKLDVCDVDDVLRGNITTLCNAAEILQSMAFELAIGMIPVRRDMLDYTFED